MNYQPFQKVIKVGDSLAVVIPRHLTKGLEMQRGDLVCLNVVAANMIHVRLLDPAEIAIVLKNNPFINNETIE